MVTTRGALKDNNNERKSLKKGIKYCKDQIKKKPEKWVVKEYRGVIKNDMARLSQLKRHDKKLRILAKKTK